MTIRVSIPQKHNIIRKTYNKQAGAPAPAPLTISLFHSTPPQALPPGSPAPSHPHTSHKAHHSVPQPSHPDMSIHGHLVCDCLYKDFSVQIRRYPNIKISLSEQAS